MGKILKVLAIVIGVLIGLVALGVRAAFLTTESRLNKVYDVDPGSITIPSSPDALDEGQRLATIRGCTDCHTADLGGGVMIDDPAIGTIYATNLTSGEGGVGQEYGAADYLRAIRHGVDAGGNGLIIMPSHEYYVLSDEDTGALIAYIEGVDPVDREIPVPEVGMLGKVLFMLGQLPPLAAEIIDHDAQRPAAPAREVSVEFGAYVATSCTGCHGADFSGGPIPGAPPDTQEAANLTPAGNLGDWTEAEFIQAMRTGFTPEGKALDPKLMPWPIANAMTEVELRALWTYLHSLDPVE